MGEDHTIRAVERLRIDALYGKKKHFNAADRKERYNTCIGVALIVANAIIASNLVYVIVSDIRAFGAIISLIGFVATVLAVVQAFFNYSRTAEPSNWMVATRSPRKDRRRALLNEGILIGMAPTRQMRSREQPGDPAPRVSELEMPSASRRTGRTTRKPAEGFLRTAKRGSFSGSRWERYRRL